MKWIRQRFLRSSIDRQCPPVYGVSSDQPSQWEETVRKPAFQVVEAYVNGTEVRRLLVMDLEKHIDKSTYDFRV